jgi:phage tail sheath gpL-like
VFLIQMLLPVDGQSATGGEEQAMRTRAELVERFGGMTAYVQTPALGEWTAAGGQRERDRVVMIEVVAPQFDRTWWRSYADTLADRFRQDAIHVRALQVEMLDPDAV